jgi:outer membrane biogenesis lipoprotein LolB
MMMMMRRRTDIRSGAASTTTTTTTKTTTTVAATTTKPTKCTKHGEFNQHNQFETLFQHGYKQPTFQVYTTNMWIEATIT